VTSGVPKKQGGPWYGLKEGGYWEHAFHSDLVLSVPPYARVSKVQTDLDIPVGISSREWTRQGVCPYRECLKENNLYTNRWFHLRIHAVKMTFLKIMMGVYASLGLDSLTRSPSCCEECPVLVKANKLKSRALALPRPSPTSFLSCGGHESKHTSHWGKNVGRQCGGMTFWY
jgi:hypothetical protein